MPVDDPLVYGDCAVIICRVYRTPLGQLKACRRGETREDENWAELRASGFSKGRDALLGPQRARGTVGNALD
jgi:hypothetical protein